MAESRASTRPGSPPPPDLVDRAAPSSRLAEPDGSVVAGGRGDGDVADRHLEETP